MSYRISIAILNEIAELIQQHSGLYFPPSHLKVLDQRIVISIKELNCTEKDFLLLLQQDIQALNKFIDHVTTNFTHFFRSIEQFHMIQTELLPILFRENTDTKHINIWSAACSSGEEPYSLALFLYSYLKENNLSHWSFNILASDISDQQLKVAEEGIYPLEALSRIPKQYHALLEIKNNPPEYLNSIEDKYISMPDFIKNKIVFKSHNLIIPLSSYSNFDIIMCRNVLIYFDDPTQEVVINNFYNLLKPNRFLIISPSESLSTIKTKFTAKILTKSVYYMNEVSNG